MKKLLASFGLILAGTVFSLGIVELALRITGLTFGPGIDAVIEDYRVGWINQPNQRKLVCNKILPECVRIRTNEQSLREDDPTSFDKDPGINRILVLGDSQTAADLVENNQTYPNVVEELLNENDGAEVYEVINGGVRGYSPVQEWLWFREFGIQYQPGILIMGFYVGNDLLEMYGSDSLPHFRLISDDVIVLENYPVKSNSRELNSKEEEGALNLKRLLRPFQIYQTVRIVAENSAFADSLREVGLLQPERQGPLNQALSICHGCVNQSLSQSYYLTRAEEEIRFRMLEENLRRLKDEAEGANSRLIILLIPTKLQVEPELEPDLNQSAQFLDLKIDDAIANDQRIHDRVMGLSSKLGIEVIGVLPALHAYHRQHEGEPLFFNKDWHLTPLGHRVLAMEVYQYLIDHQTPG